MADPLRLVEVGYVDEHGRLVTIRISADTVPAAREHGWMVFEDFEVLMAAFNRPRLSSPQGDGDQGDDAA